MGGTYYNNKFQFSVLISCVSKPAIVTARGYRVCYQLVRYEYEKKAIVVCQVFMYTRYFYKAVAVPRSGTLSRIQLLNCSEGVNKVP
jgi:hypothetical protein